MGAVGQAAPPGKLNVKTVSPLDDILIFSIHLVFSRLIFFAFFGVLWLLATIDIHYIRIQYHFLTIFWVLASCHYAVTSGPPSVKFRSTWLKPLLTLLLIMVLVNLNSRIFVHIKSAQLRIPVLVCSLQSECGCRQVRSQGGATGAMCTRNSKVFRLIKYLKYKPKKYFRANQRKSIG